MSQDVAYETSKWILAQDAPARVNRGRSTIYKWVKAGRIRTMRPARGLWLYLPDLLKADKEAIRTIALDEAGETV